MTQGTVSCSHRAATCTANHSRLSQVAVDDFATPRNLAWTCALTRRSGAVVKRTSAWASLRSGRSSEFLCAYHGPDASVRLVIMQDGPGGRRTAPLRNPGCLCSATTDIPIDALRGANCHVHIPTWSLSARTVSPTSRIQACRRLSKGPTPPSRHSPS